MTGAPLLCADYRLLTRLQIDWPAIAVRLDSVRARIETYRSIQDMLLKTDVSIDQVFQQRFRGFYKVRRGLDSPFQSVFFSLLEREKMNSALEFEQVLRAVALATGRLEASFSSKLLATVRPEMPVLDSVVGGHLGVRRPSLALSMNQRITEATFGYQRLCDWYEGASTQADYALLVQEFDRHFPQFTDFSGTKKIDLILWQSR